MDYTSVTEGISWINIYCFIPGTVNTSLTLKIRFVNFVNDPYL